MPSCPVELQDVTMSFGAVSAIHGVSLSVAQGEMFGLIGHNGAGKTTLFKLMLGLLAPTSGTIKVGGVSTHAGDFRDVRRRIGYLPESFVTYDNLSGLEVVRLFADLKKVPRSACADVLAQVGLSDAATRRVHTYSKGMRQRLGFAQVLLGSPDLIFLDEPTNGLDPDGIHHFYALLRAAQARGTTIVITSHILAEIQDRVDRLVILDSGGIAAQGTLAQLRAQRVLPSVIEVTVRSGQLETIEAALASWSALSLRSAGDRLYVSCPSTQKVAVLARLAPLAGAMTDLVIHEPSLEDLFLGVGGAHVGKH